MPFVMDASIAASWAFADEEGEIGRRAQHRIQGDAALAPAIWWFEVRNALLMGERRGRISEADVASFLRQLSRLSPSIDQHPIEADMMSLARRHRLTVYDAAYLELALRLGAPIATLDGPLSEACVAAGGSLV